MLPDDPSTVVPSAAAPARLQQLAARTCTALADAPVVAQQACFLPLSPDNRPLIGAVPGVEHAFVATAHGCWGILNGPVTGLALAQLLLDGKSTIVDLTPFSPGRFV